MTMITTRSQQLTDSFSRWGRAGRGWQNWPYRVPLEPPFQLFRGFEPDRSPFIDDARKPHWLVRLSQQLFSGNGGTKNETQESSADVVPPDPVKSDLMWSERELLVSIDAKHDRDAPLGWLSSLATCCEPIAFEIIGYSGRVAIRLAANPTDLALAAGNLQAFFSKVGAVEPVESVQSLWKRASGNAALAIEFGLGSEFLLPLSIPRGTDALAAFVNALASLKSDELGLVQLIFEETKNPWAKSSRRAIVTPSCKPFFADAPEFTKLAQQKLSTSLYAVVLRIAANADHEDRAWELIRHLAGGFGQLGAPDRNELIPLGVDDREQLLRDILDRATHRSGMLWSAEELVSLVHPPSSAIHCEKLVRQIKKTKAAPAMTTNLDLVLGENVHAGQTITVGLTTSQRLRHMHVIGASGSGKSTLLLNLINQDITSGRGVGVLDPHGDLIDAVMARIPEVRLPDVVLLDPADEEFPIAFNILTAHSELEKNLLASDLVAVFRRLSTSWGDQMNSVLANAIIAFLESHSGGTMIDLRRFLIEANYRHDFLETVQDEEIVYFWQREFPLLTGRPQASILTRLDAFLRPKPIRHMVGQKENHLDLRAAMNDSKIVLAKLAHGAIGEENAHLLGSFLLSKFHQAAISRQDMAEKARRPFYLYIDEFHHFVCPSMASILSGARKYGLGLILAHQELRQLGSRQDDVSQAILANPCTRLCFRVGDDDARKLADGFIAFEAKDLLNLGVGEALGRIEQAQHDFNLRTDIPPSVDESLAISRQAQVRTLSRAKYATPKAEVVNKLAAQRSPQADAPPPQTRPLKKDKAAAPLPPLIIEKSTSISDVPRFVEPILPAFSPKPANAGRGGQQHKYLQHLIKGWAERRGFKATVEETILGGLGSVDVVIEQGDYRLACEITITTSAAHELGNIQKCLAADFSQVAVVAAERRALQQVKKVAEESLDGTALEKLLFFTPEELFTHLEALKAKSNSADDNVRGYRVKVEYASVEEAAAKARRQAVGNVMLNALKRLKGQRGEENGQNNSRNGTGNS